MIESKTHPIDLSKTDRVFFDFTWLLDVGH